MDVEGMKRRWRERDYEAVPQKSAPRPKSPEPERFVECERCGALTGILTPWFGDYWLCWTYSEVFVMLKGFGERVGMMYRHPVEHGEPPY